MRSEIVGMLVLMEIQNAGHTQFKRAITRYDFHTGHIRVRLSTRAADEQPGGEQCIDFSIPEELFDPGAYCRATWPQWFIKAANEDPV
jgi:hypothetical protein